MSNGVIDLRANCPECGADFVRVSEKQKRALLKAIQDLKEHGFEVKLVRMYQAEPVMMAMMISKSEK